SDQHRDFNETIKQYENLLQVCELCNSPEKTAKLLHNYAYENLRRNKYQKSLQLYEQSMELKEEYSTIYLLSLEGYIRSANNGEILSDEDLLDYVYKGLDIAKTINNQLYIIVFMLHKYIFLKQHKNYYNYLAGEAVPYFKKHGYVALAKKYERELFDYHIRNRDTDQALEVAEMLIKEG